VGRSSERRKGTNGTHHDVRLSKAFGNGRMYPEIAFIYRDLEIAFQAKHRPATLYLAQL
jgi:hypothetical protein